MYHIVFYCQMLRNISLNSKVLLNQFLRISYLPGQPLNLFLKVLEQVTLSQYEVEYDKSLLYGQDRKLTPTIDFPWKQFTC